MGAALLDPTPRQLLCRRREVDSLKFGTMKHACQPFSEVCTDRIDMAQQPLTCRILPSIRTLAVAFSCSSATCKSQSDPITSCSFNVIINGSSIKPLHHQNPLKATHHWQDGPKNHQGMPTW